MMAAARSDAGPDRNPDRNPGRNPGANLRGPGTGVAREAIRLSLRADPGSVRAALVQLRADLLGAGIAADDVATAELVLAEVLNNVVEHAFAGLGGGRIELTVAPGKAALACEVRDDGRPMPCSALPRGALPRGTLPGGALPAAGLPAAGSSARDPALEALPEGGFGWFLIHSLARDLAYARQGGANLLGLSIPLGGGA